MDPENRRFSRRVAIQGLAGLSVAVIAGVVFGTVELVDGDDSGGVLALAIAVMCVWMGRAMWSMNRAVLLSGPEDRAVGPFVRVPPYWVRSRLTTTEYAVSDAEGEWVGDFDRRGARGYRARARDRERMVRRHRLAALSRVLVSGERPVA